LRGEAAESTEVGDRLVALMPMRHDSERVPGKNYRPFGDGRPLFEHMLDSLVGCPEIDRVVIDTDSPTIKEHCAGHHPEVVVLDRPQHLLSGMTPMNEVLLHDVAQVESEFYLQTHSTNPLLTTETLRRAIRTFFDGYPDHDSLFGVTRLQTRLWDGSGRAVNHDPNVLIRTQDLPPLFEENSCIYIFARETLRERHNRIGERPYLFEIDRLEAVDIDDEVDFEIAELIFERRKRG
jgi:CMP-N-acetylneuraminic acid synthetase